MPVPHVLFVESNTAGTGARFCERARERGLAPVLVAADPARYPFLEQGLAGIEVADTADAEAVLRVAERLRRAGGLAGVTSTSEYFVEVAAEVAAVLGLPAPPADAVRTCRSKARLGEVLAAAGVLVPAGRVVRSSEEAASAAGELGLPVVVKPVGGSGSVGVRRADTPEAATAFAAGLLAERTNERGLPVPAEALVQELVDGREYSVECLGSEVVGVTAKHLGGPAGTFVETGHDHPAPRTPEVEAVARAARAALRALSFGFGPTHTEVRASRRGPVVIEVNPRLGGGFIPEIVRHATGIDLVDASLSAAIGAPVDLAPRRALHASIRFLTTPQPGVLDRLDGVEAAAEVPGVVEVATYRRPGSFVEVHGDFRDRIGHVVAVGEDLAQSACAAEWGLSLLRARVRDGFARDR